MAKSKKSTSKQKNLGQNRVNSNNNKSEETQHKTSKIERFFSGVNLGLSLIAIVISVLALFISWSQVDLEYRLNLPNLNMDVELFLNEDTNEEILKYQIINNGGNIREATIIPHMYLTYICSPDFGAEYESSYAIELNDFFAPHYKNGIYYSSVIPYNVKENSWIFDINKSRINEGLDLLHLVGEPFSESGTMFCLDLCLEISYFDVKGNQHVDWYNASSELFYDLSEAYSYSPQTSQLRHINKDSLPSLQVYKNAIGLNMADFIKDGEIICDEDNLTSLSQLCAEGLFGE